MQDRLKTIQNWDELDSIAIDVLAENELEKYQKNKN
ncbi:MAG: hypothetical protein CEN91_205, partial [Candidatus Berkelbacteria bacterium Licking1014_85]